MTTPAAPAAPKGRLGNGQLRRQVAEYLTDHPGPCKTGDIAKSLLIKGLMFSEWSDRIDVVAAE